MRLPRMITAACLSCLAFACDKPAAPSAAEKAAGETAAESATEETAAETATEVDDEAAPTAEALPVPQDFEEESAKEISEANYKAKLAALEAEIEAADE